MKAEIANMKVEFAELETLKKDLDEAQKNRNLIADANRDCFASNGTLSEELENANKSLKPSEEALKTTEEARFQALTELDNLKKSLHDHTLLDDLFELAPQFWLSR